MQQQNQEVAREERIKELDANKRQLLCERQMFMSWRGWVFTAGACSVGAVISALAPNHWPQRTRLAPFVWAGVIGSIADHFNIAYTCEHYHPTYVPKFAPSRPPMTEAEFAKQEAEQREIIQRMRKEDKKQ